MNPHPVVAPVAYCLSAVNAFLAAFIGFGHCAVHVNLLVLLQSYQNLGNLVKHFLHLCFQEDRGEVHSWAYRPSLIISHALMAEVNPPLVRSKY
jgi:hypothetical protein